jgi:hypothetical protein
MGCKGRRSCTTRAAVSSLRDNMLERVTTRLRTWARRGRGCKMGARGRSLTELSERYTKREEGGREKAGLVTGTRENDTEQL